MKFFYFAIVVLTLIGCALSSGYETARPAKCLQPIEPGICYGHMKRYGYNVGQNKCEEFIYGGCAGNDNRFDTLLECQTTCKSAE